MNIHNNGTYEKIYLTTNIHVQVIEKLDIGKYDGMKYFASLPVFEMLLRIENTMVSRYR